MRSRVLVILLFLLVFSFQGKLYSQISIGAYTGYASNKVVGDSGPYGFYDIKGGGIIGFRIDIPVSEAIKFSFLPTIGHYRGKLMVYDWNDQPLDSLNVKFNDFLLPVGITITSPKDRFYVFGGFELHLPISFKAYGLGNVKDLTPILREYNLGIQFSAGYKFPIGKSNLYFEIGYSQSIMKQTEESDIFEAEALRVRLRDIRYLIGVQVPLSNKTLTN